MVNSDGRGSTRNLSNFLWMVSRKIKQLQNLYSWNEFYQARKMKDAMRKCQTEIHQLKSEINELKTKKK